MGTGGTGERKQGVNVKNMKLGKHPPSWEIEEVIHFKSEKSTGVAYRPKLPEEEKNKWIKRMEEAAIVLIQECRYNKARAKSGELEENGE